MNKKISFKELDFSFLCLFFLTVPFSVTVSQAFAILSILSYLAFRLPKFKDFPRIFWILITLYLSILLSRIWADVSLGRPLLALVSKSEISDFWMSFLLLPASNFSREQKKICLRFLKYVGILFLITGFLSLIFPYRLSSFVMDGFSYQPGRRLPHQIGFLPGINLSLFLPIGFQNTHLTYGALLGLFFPSIFFHTVRLFKIRKKTKGKFVFYAYLYVLLSSCSVLLILLNQSRSIWLGLLLSFGFFVNSNSIFRFNKNKLWRIIFALGIFCLISVILYQENWLFRRSIEQLFTKQTLENQRIWIHKANFEMIKNHPFLGIGAGNYTEYFEKSYIPILEKKSYLYYEILITPKSHAHHDFLHFFILGGIASATCFILFWYEIIKNLLKQGKRIANFVGFFAIFIGGMFQCFMLDDETFLPLLAVFSLTNRFKFTRDIKTSYLVCIPLLLSVSSLYHFSRTGDDQLFIHRTRDEINRISPIAQKTINGHYAKLGNLDSESFYFKLEGCLNQSKNFHSIPRTRKDPLELEIEIPSEQNHSTFPYKYEMELRERDAFDQDKLFKVHSESVLAVFHGEFTFGINKLVIPLPASKELGDLKFYDLGIRYFFPTSAPNPTLPVVHMQENCD